MTLGMTSGKHVGRYVPCICWIWLLLILSISTQGQNVIGWGDDSHGQIDVPSAATNVIAVAAGKYHSLALRSDGTVLGWGSDSSGASAVPGSASNIIAIAAGFSHSLALRADGTVLGWGNNTYKQLNIPSAATNVVAIAAGHNHSLALRADGTVLVWGQNSLGQCNVPTNLSKAIAIAAGPVMTLVLLANGDVVPVGTRADYYDYFRSVRGIVALAGRDGGDVALKGDGSIVVRRPVNPLVPQQTTNIIAIAAGTNISLALTETGQVLAWRSMTLTNVPDAATNIIAIAAGIDHCLAVKGDGMSPSLIASIGFRQSAQFGDLLPLAARATGAQRLQYQWLADGVPIPNATGPFPRIPATVGTDGVGYQVIVSDPYGSITSSVARVSVRAVNVWGNLLDGQFDVPDSASNCVRVAAGEFHCLFLNPDGTGGGWGKNVDGQTDFPGNATNLIGIAAGGDHSLSLRRDGSVIAWGRDWDGQTDVPAEATNVISIAAGWAHSLALRADGTVLAWGNNEYGQTKVPVLPTKAVAIAAGKYHSMALRTDGTVATWGLNYAVPPEATNVVRIAAGYENCLAVRADGSVIAWGDNSYGQCSVPAGLTNVISIAAGYYHAMALRADGSIVAWGKNSFGVTEIPPGADEIQCISGGEDFNIILASRGAPGFGPQIASITSHSGGAVTLSPEVQGSVPLEFQWFHDGVEVAGATNQSLFMLNIDVSNTGTYLLVAVNAEGRATNQAVIVSVDPVPFLASAFAYKNVPIGGSLCLEPQVLGAGSLSYQWQLNGTNLVDRPRVQGSHEGRLCLQKAQPGDSGYYSLIVSNTYGVITGTVAQVAVTEAIVWGDDSFGQTEVPAGATNLLAAAAGGDHNLVLRKDGTVLAWGDDTHGQSDIPEGASNVVAIAAGLNHSVAVRGDGKVIAWGDNSYGQTNVPSFGTNVIAVAAGANHTIALLADNSAIAWGADNARQTNLPNLHGTGIAAGGDQSLILLGGTIYDTSSMFTLFSLSTAVGVAAGSLHGLVLKSDASVIGWGNNSFGQISIPSFGVRPLAIAAGDVHSIALLSDGTLICWGADFAGQCSPPVLAQVRAIAAGGSHSLAIIGKPPPFAPPSFEIVASSVAFTNGAFRLRLSNLTGQGPTVISASTNLMDWAPIYTNPATVGSFDFMDPASSALPQRMYRGFEQR